MSNPKKRRKNIPWGFVGAVLTAVVALIVALPELIPLFNSLFTQTSKPPSCPPGLECYRSDFRDFDTTLFREFPQSGYEIRDGNIVITVSNDADIEIKPQESLAWGLKFVELTVTIEEAGGEAGHAFAGILTELGNDSYTAFQLDSAGNAVVEHGLAENPTERDMTVFLDGIGQSHKLRLENTGRELIFSVDGTELDTKLPTETLGNWFVIDVYTWPNASITVKFEEVIWAVLH